MNTTLSVTAESYRKQILNAAYDGRGNIAFLDYNDAFGISKNDSAFLVNSVLDELERSGLVNKIGKGADDGVSFKITMQGIKEYEKITAI